MAVKMEQLDRFYDAQFSLLRKDIERYNGQKLKLFVTSSFQTQSLPLLHMVSKIEADIEVFFIDTGYLFPQTYEFAREISTTLALRVKRVRSTISMKQQSGVNGHMLFSEDPDLCCRINKVQPLQEAYADYDVWINGIRMDQSDTRSNRKRYETNIDGLIRLHPMLEWTSKHVYYYSQKHNLPKHPLDHKGYTSIGCLPCTSSHCSVQPGNSRAGRWEGRKKTECGLHTQI